MVHAQLQIEELGHTGLWVRDLDVMKRFYSVVLGLTVTDQDDDLGIVFLSSRPAVEHHELVLQAGRTAAEDVRLNHQISWRVATLDVLLGYFKRLQDEGVLIQQVVTHGNAIGVYFFDPEGNRNEVYWQTGVAVPQPFLKHLNLDQSVEAILREAQSLLA
jgi:catechol-2,3-dioxygenase